MPSKKKAHEDVDPIDEVRREVIEQSEESISELAEKASTCGHVNKQHTNADGKLEDLACALPAGHPGDHQAPYEKKVADQVHDEKGRVVKTTYHLEPAVSYWNDAAGKPADQVRVGEVEQMTGFQKDLVMQILKENPNINVDQAIAEARKSPAWNSVNELS